MSTITLIPIIHRNEPQISIKFPYDERIKDYVKLLEGVRWSKTHSSFYIAHNAVQKRNLYQHLRKQNWFVDYKALKPSVSAKVISTIPVKNSHDTLGALTDTHLSLLKRFHGYLLQKRYSDNTAITYVGVLKVFFRFYASKAIDTITEQDVIRFNQDYVLARGFGRTFQNQTISALKLFYRTCTNIHLDINELERPKKDRRLPEVLSIEEIKHLFSTIKNEKHKTILSVVYACGLRIGEALSLKINDIDSERGFIHIKHAKGAKDRYVPLSDKTLALLRDYYKLYRSKDYIFEGVEGIYSQASCRKILINALQKTPIKKRVTLHTLRHSFANHLLENGTDLRYIQEILGHNSPKTTMIYTHVTKPSLKKIKNPFDDM